MGHNGDIENDKEREFCVRDVPASICEWDIFFTFNKFGLVDNVRIPPNQEREQLKFSFVTMLNLAGADAVREALVNGKLSAGNAALRVNDVRNGGGAKPQNKFNGYNRGGNKYNEKSAALPKKKIAYVTVDLPLKKECNVRVVPSPLPVSQEKGLTFHVLNLSIVPANEYTQLQKEMNDYCQNPNNAINDVEIGEAVLYFSENVAYRALRTGRNSIYLVEMGREMPIVPKTFFKMQEHFAFLPTLVVECSIANVEWTHNSVDMFQHIREVVGKWCETDGPLKAILHSFKGLVNMVTLVGNESADLKKSLAKRGGLRLIEETEPRSYDRDVMNTIHQKVTANPTTYPVNIENARGILVAEKKKKTLEESMKDLAV